MTGWSLKTVVGSRWSWVRVTFLAASTLRYIRVPMCLKRHCCSHRITLPKRGTRWSRFSLEWSFQQHIRETMVLASSDECSQDWLRQLDQQKHLGFHFFAHIFAFLCAQVVEKAKSLAFAFFLKRLRMLEVETQPEIGPSCISTCQYVMAELDGNSDFGFLVSIGRTRR